jgi:hypothetical protein
MCPRDPPVPAPLRQHYGYALKKIADDHNVESLAAENLVGTDRVRFISLTTQRCNRVDQVALFAQSPFDMWIGRTGTGTRTSGAGAEKAEGRRILRPCPKTATLPLKATAPPGLAQVGPSATFESATAGR